jgi:ComF family protein
MPLTQPGAPCPYCKGKGVPHYERLVRLGIFDDPLKSIIYQIKYHNRWSLAEHLAERMWRHAPIREVLERVDCLVAVPLHPLREIHRGYNQAQLIAARLARRSKLRLIKPLVRLRNTSSQTRLPSRARRDANLKDAFGLLNASVVSGKKIAIVDDVTTSGATLQSVARTLKPADPAEMYAIVAAIADPKHYDFQMI